MDNLGLNIKLARTRKGLKQKELAEILNISINYMSLLESNKRVPSLQMLKKISDILGMPMYKFFMEDYV